MMKRWITSIGALMLTVAVLATPVLAQETNCGKNYTDTKVDGICDNRTEFCQGNGKRGRFCRMAVEMEPQPCSRGAGYVDEDGDGICDNRRAGYTDEDNDGVCDNRGTGHQGSGQGCRRGQNR
jgi:hypothetical protein